MEGLCTFFWEFWWDRVGRLAIVAMGWAEGRLFHFSELGWVDSGSRGFRCSRDGFVFGSL